MNMKNLLKVLLVMVAVVGFNTASQADISRLYLGEMDGQFMAGLDSRVYLGPLYLGGDVRTLIGSTITNSEKYAVMGFSPARTDYTFAAGVNVGAVNLEYATTCYHRVISSTDLAQYLNTVEIPNTQSFKVKLNF
jgi:hypothetical protein